MDSSELSGNSNDVGDWRQVESCHTLLSAGTYETVFRIEAANAGFDPADADASTPRARAVRDHQPQGLSSNSAQGGVFHDELREDIAAGRTDDQRLGLEVSRAARTGCQSIAKKEESHPVKNAVHCSIFTAFAGFGC